MNFTLNWEDQQGTLESWKMTFEPIWRMKKTLSDRREWSTEILGGCSEQVSMWFPRKFYGILMRFPWDFYGIPIGFPWYSTGVLWYYYGILGKVSMGFPWCFYVISVGFLWDSSMAFPWDFHDVSMIFLWDYYGISKGNLCDS